ncbi:MAG: hypothetical protein GXP42_12520 [Chloroflexi bacterium]|nr:hypothetical protein [Chloroflexota bacterium]
METVTPRQIQTMIKRLPKSKLRLVYDFVSELTQEDEEMHSSQVEFLRLPLEERRRLMAEQAEHMIMHYEQTANQRQDWQAGDFLDEY